MNLEKEQIEQELKEKLLNELFENQNNVQNACRKLKIDRHKHYTWLEQDEEYKTKHKQIIKFIADEVFQQLLKKAREGDTNAIIFFLKNYAKYLSFSEESESSDRIAEINVNIVTNAS